jgi:hypothetical protein
LITDKDIKKLFGNKFCKSPTINRLKVVSVFIDDITLGNIVSIIAQDDYAKNYIGEEEIWFDAFPGFRILYKTLKNEAESRNDCPEGIKWDKSITISEEDGVLLTISGGHDYDRENDSYYIYRIWGYLQPGLEITDIGTEDSYAD